VALIDVELPDGDGIELSAELRRLLPDLAVVIVTGDSDLMGKARRALEAGARGFVVKQGRLDIERCADAIRAAARGDQTIDGRLAHFIGNILSRSDPIRAAGLSPREVEVLELVAEGLTNEQIASRLHIAKQTVKNHVHKITGKLDARNRTHAAKVARDRGIVSGESTGDP
jgi:two-component system response regulator DesR